jgi:hypothetical protein
MKTPEARVKDAIKKFLDRQEQCWYFMPVPMGRGQSALDFVGCHRGRAFMIEAKAIGGKETTRQRLCREDAERAGTKVFVVYGAPMFIKIAGGGWFGMEHWFASE